MPEKSAFDATATLKASDTPLRAQERLDRDRIASMADEGGSAGAVADLREQLNYPAHMHVEEAPLPAPLAGSRPASSRWRIVALGALALSAGFLLAIGLRYRNRKL